MLIEKADMLDALLGNFAGMDLLTDAAEGNCVVLGYVTGWLDAIGTLIHVDEKKHSEKKKLLEQLKQSCARVNAEGYCDTAEQIEEGLEAMNAREDERGACRKCVGTTEVMTMRLIDADALVETFAKVLHRHDSGAEELRYDFVKKVIDNAPTCCQERRGRWEISPTHGFLMCSVCHNCYIDEDWLDGKKWNFCLECGAKMNGGDDDETD